MKNVVVKTNKKVLPLCCYCRGNRGRWTVLVSTMLNLVNICLGNVRDCKLMYFEVNVGKVTLRCSRGSYLMMYDRFSLSCFGLGGLRLHD